MGDTSVVPAKRCRVCRREGEWPGQPCPLCRAKLTPENPSELQQRVRTLHVQIKGWEDDVRRAELRADELAAELAELEKRLAIADESKRRAEDKIIGAREELAELKRLVPAASVAEPPPPAPEPSAVRVDAPETIRKAILRVKSFTVVEMAAILGLSVKATLALLEGEVKNGIIRDTGEKFQRSPVFEYVEPTDPGEAFRIQQEQREREPSPDVVFALPVAGIGEGYLAALAKDVRREARKAMHDGWSLMQSGSGHYQLVRGGVTVHVPGTPANPSAAARKVRDDLARDNGGVTRGMPIPRTGQPIGSSGKPGLDKARANAGMTVRRKGKRGM